MGKNKIGAKIVLTEDVAEKIKKLKELGFETCQIACPNKESFTQDNIDIIDSAVNDSGIEITAVFSGGPSPNIYNFYAGPLTIGLVPPAFRYARMESIMRASDFAKELGVKNIGTHVGFIPENPNDPDYNGVVYTIKHLAEYLKTNGQSFLFETGQETPITLKRIINDIGLDNLGVNFDPANLLMYGKANPLDALDILGDYVLEVHAKDGEYPLNGTKLGLEKPLGQGRVDFPVFINKLKNLGYQGAITIEREISGPEQTKDILLAKELLEKLV